MEMLIAVIGGGECSAEEAEMAEIVGRKLAQHGVTLICGGLKGIMEAACKGAFFAGGRTIGILPGNSRDDANSYVSIPIVTGMMYARNIIIVKSACAAIAIGGSYGTLSEIAHALQNGVPVIGLNTWSFSRGAKKDLSIIKARDASDAVRKAIATAREKNTRR